MNQNSISTRVSESTLAYLDANYKNKFQGARLCLEAYPIMREESLNNIKGVFDADEMAFLVFAYKGENLNGRDLSSRRKFEGMVADYYESNKELHLSLNFNIFIGKIRKLGVMERFVLCEISQGVHTNPVITEELINYLSA